MDRTERPTTRAPAGGNLPTLALRAVLAATGAPAELPPRAAETALVDLKPVQGIRTRRRRGRGSGVNKRLTPRTPRETADVAAGIGRMIRGLSRRAEAGDLEAVPALRQLDLMLGRELLRAVHGLHVQHGYSWREIGLAAGISRQAAEKRWGAS